jgi:hypothetical protein
MTNRLDKRSRGTRESTKTEGSPAPTAGPTSGGITPEVGIATPESVKDVGSPTQMSYTTGFGYTFHDLDGLAPNDDRIQSFLRVVRYSPRGYFGAVPVGMGYERIDHFFSAWLYDRILEKAVKRDGYRHLPDTIDNPGIMEARDALFTCEVNNVLAVRAHIDSINWNDATRYIGGELSRKNRRATEVWNALKTIEMNQLSRAHGLLHPPIADKPGGAVLTTLINAKEWFAKFGTIDVSHPCCNDWDVSSFAWTSDNIDNILAEAEAAIQVIRGDIFVKAMDNDSGGGLAWTAATSSPANRGSQQDVKYWATLLHELVYPEGLPETPQIAVDTMRFNEILFGDAIYGVQENWLVTVPDHWYSVGYPYVTDAPMGLVYRRGFAPIDELHYAGMREIWALQKRFSSDNGADQSYLGCFASMSTTAKDSLLNGNAYLMWSRVVAGASQFRTSNPLGYNYDDGTDLRLFMEDGSPYADHQWNEMLFGKLDPSAPIHGPAGMKAYGYHMPINVPCDMLRAAWCAAHNIPFVR